MTSQRRVVVSGHAVDRLRQRVPELSTTTIRDAHRLLSGVFHNGVVVGGQQGRDQLVEATCATSGRKVALAVTRLANGTTVIKTVLTVDQMTANAQALGCQAVTADEMTCHQPRSERDGRRSGRRRRRRWNQQFSVSDRRRFDNVFDKTKRLTLGRERAKTTREWLDAETVTVSPLVV